MNEIGNSISQASFLKLMKRLVEAKQRLTDASKLAAEERGVIRGVLKTLETEGGSKLAVKLLDTLGGIENEGERDAALQDLFRFAGWTGVQLWTPPTAAQPQGRMFESPEAEQAAGDLQDARDHADGTNSRRAGASVSDNPKQVGTRAHQQWDRGWRDQDYEMGDSPTQAPMKASLARKPRASKADQQAAKPAPNGHAGKPATKRGRPAGKKATPQPAAA